MGNGKKKAIVPNFTTKKEATHSPSNNPESYLTKSPSWAFYHIDCDKWCIHEDFFTKITDKLCSFEKMTWQEILSAPKSGYNSTGSKSHIISVEKLCREAQRRLEELHIHDDELLSLRLSGKERIFGILDMGVLRIIWYDPDHQICPSNT